MAYGALREIDRAVARWLELLGSEDLLVLTADHGCDPTAAHTDHTREFAPLLARFGGQRPRRHDGPLADVGASALRWLNAPVLPLDHARAARALTAELEALQAAADPRFDLSPVLEAARTLGERLQRVSTLAAAPPAARVEAVNRGLMRLSRVLVPLAYTTGDRFTHDLALPIPPLAGLQRARELAALDPHGDAARFTVAALVRERNRALHALDSAASIADELVSLDDRR